MADKVTKNIFASECIWESLKDVKTVGVVSEDEDKGLVSIAEPMGVIAGVTPVTNPTSTVIFKSMIALKTRNTIVFGFHPQAQKSCVMAGKLVEAAAEAAGAPKDSILWIEEPSLEATTALMHNPNVSLILATGGPSMVSAAYSSGKPALGVGPGNGPAYVAESANVTKAIDDIVTSKTFDNGMICASENSIVVDASIYDEVKKLLKGHGAYFLNDEQVPGSARHLSMKSAALFAVCWPARAPRKLQRCAALKFRLTRASSLQNLTASAENTRFQLKSCHLF